MPEADSTTYLGATIRKDHKALPEVNSEISKCFATLGRLNYFWDNSNCDTKFKLTTFDAVVRSKLVYGLESLELTKGQTSRIDKESSQT